MSEHKINTAGLAAYPSRVAGFMPAVRGRCPHCGRESLFLATGGYVTCAALDCHKPTAASDLLGATTVP